MKAKFFMWMSNLLVLANLVVGFLKFHWALIAVFIVLHAVVRLGYLSAQEAQDNPNATKTSIAPPMVKNIATILSAVILAGLLYAIGYGIAWAVGR